MHYMPTTISEQIGVKNRMRFFKAILFAFSCLYAVTLTGCGKDAALENTKQDSVNISAREDFSGNETLSAQISDPLAASLETGKSAAQKNTLSDTWSRHAFLLKDHTVFSVCLPEQFWCDLNSLLVPAYNEYYGESTGGDPYAVIWCTGTANVKRDVNCHYFLTARTTSQLHDFSQSKDTVVQQDSDFIFADGSAGRIFRYRSGMMTHECIFSPSGRQCFYADLATDIYKNDYQEYAERMRASMMFHPNRISANPDEAQEKVMFHSSFPAFVDMELPAESIVAFRHGRGMDELLIYLTKNQDSWISMHLGTTGCMAVEWSERCIGTLVDKSYRERASYIFDEKNGSLEYLFAYGGGRLSAEVHVPSGDEKKLQAALDVIRSIDFYEVDLPMDEW